MSGAKVWGPSSPSSELPFPPFNPPALSPSSHCPILKLRTAAEVLDSSSRLSKSLAVLQRPTRHPSSRHQTSAFVAQIDPSVFVATPMCQPSTTEFMRSAIKHAVPDVKVESIRPLPCDPSQRVFSVDVSDGRTLMFALSPSPTLRLLRSEKWLALTNLLVIRWLRSVSESAIGADGKALPGDLALADGIGTRPAKGKQHARAKTADAPKRAVLPYVPTPISNSSPTTELSSGFFNLTEPPNGVPLSRLPKPLTGHERGTIDFQTGRMIRRLSEVRSPNGTFGPAIAVIGPRHSPQQQYGSQSITAGGSGGAGTWTRAFHSLLESILRDGEDMAITISYAPIRYHFRRLAHLLDAVTVSRMVVLDAGDDDNILVAGASTKTNREKITQNSKGEIRTHPTGDASDLGKEEAQRVISERSRETELEGTAAGTTLLHQPNVAVMGLWNWSNTVFGDPLFATVFSRETSSEFLRGFRQQPPRSPSPTLSPRSTPALKQEVNRGHKTTATDATTPRFYDHDEPEDPRGSNNDGENNSASADCRDEGLEGLDGDSIDDDDEYSDEYDDVVEDRANAAVRLLLYECYHATTSVVRQFYRPDAGSAARELTARRRLAAVLARLGEVEEAAIGKRPRRASGDAWPAWPPVKRVRRGGG